MLNMEKSVYIEKETDARGAKIPYDIFLSHIKGKAHFNAPHIHSYYEVACVTHGNIHYNAGDTENILLCEGDIIFIPSNVPHNTYRFSAQADETSYIVVKFSPLFLYPMETTASDADCLLISPLYLEPFYLFRKEEAISTYLEGILKSILKENTERKQGYELALRGLLISLYIFLVRNCKLDDASRKRETAHIDKSSAQTLHKALTYLKENYQYSVSMQDVASACGMNYYHFSRFFKSVTNKSFNSYLLDLRLELAQQKLLQDDSPVSDIAMDCGFEYVSYFIQRFKKKTGLTPKEYRQKYKKTHADTI